MQEEFMEQQRKDDKGRGRPKSDRNTKTVTLRLEPRDWELFPSESQSFRDVEIPVSTAVSQGRDTDRFSDTHRGTTAGGIIRELLDENDELTAYHSSQIEFHNNRLSS
jgi:hypothetical protein